MIRTRWALATLLATCLLGACSDDDPKPDIADPTPSALELVGDGESVADDDAARTLDTEETVDAWLAAWNAALQTGDTTTVGDLSTPDCGSCRAS